MWTGFSRTEYVFVIHRYGYEHISGFFYAGEILDQLRDYQVVNSSSPSFN